MRDGHRRHHSIHVAEVRWWSVRTGTRCLEPGHIGTLLFSGAERARQYGVEIGRALS